MKAATRHISLTASVLLLGVAVILYFELPRSSHLAGAKNIYQSQLAKDYLSALPFESFDGRKARGLIRGDLRHAGIKGEIGSPLKKGALVFFHVRATGMTDTEFVYVFNAQCEFLEVAWIPRA
jgi:hypothetical protein